MRNREIARQIQVLQFLIKKSSQAASADIEVQSHWAKYICVLSAGFLENALVELYGGYCNRTASPRVSRFTSKSLQRIQNPKMRTFVETASTFDHLWGKELEEFSEMDGRKEAIDSIMANRHLIAHGKISGITLALVDSYLKKAIEVLEFVETQLA